MEREKSGGPLNPSSTVPICASGDSTSTPWAVALSCVTPTPWRQAKDPKLTYVPWGLNMKFLCKRAKIQKIGGFASM